MSDFFAELEAQLRTAHDRRPSRARRAAGPAALALALCLGLALVLVLGGGTARREASPRPAAPAPAQRVAVLNGTTHPGLAGRVATRLGSAGLRIDVVTNAARPNTARTQVLYRRGGELAALTAAAELGVPAVTPAPAGSVWFGGTQAGAAVVAGEDAPAAVSRPRPRTATTVLRQALTGRRLAAAVVVAGAPEQLMFAGSGLRPGLYGVWLDIGSRPMRFLGYAPPVNRRGALAFAAALPVGARRYRGLIVTRQSGRRPLRRGPVAVGGPLRFP